MSLFALGNYSSGSDLSEEEEEAKLNESSACSDNQIDAALQSTSKFFEVSDGENSTDEEVEQTNEQLPFANSGRKSNLPSALEALTNVSGISTIFSNPFKDAEQAEYDLLEQHVKLSERKKAEKPIKKSRLLCKMFKQGRCKMGDKCRFSHVIGSALLARLADPSQEPVKEPSPPPTQFESQPVLYNGREEEIEEVKPKKRKVGINDSLVPPKKALELFDKQKTSKKT